MTDKTNPNRWTAEVGPSRYYHFKVAVVSDRGRTVPIDRLTDEQAESLAEQINRPAHATNDQIVAACEANDYWWREDESGRYYVGPTIAGDGSIDWPGRPTPTARPPWFLALDVWMAMGGDSRDFDAWAYGEPRSTWGDRWAQLMAAIRGSDLGLDTNPPAGRLVDVADAWNANRPTPTAPADDLPPGVERISDGTYLCRGIDIPEGWDFYGPAESIAASEDKSRPWWDWRDREADVRTGYVYYEVRPITPAEPATEWVPWWEAAGRLDRDGHPIDSVFLGNDFPDGGYSTEGNDAEQARADGKVEVQR